MPESATLNCPPGTTRGPDGICHEVSTAIPSRSAVAALAAAPPGTTTVPESAKISDVNVAAVSARIREEQKLREAAALRGSAQDAVVKERQPTTVPAPRTGADPNALKEVEAVKRGIGDWARGVQATGGPKKAYDTLIGPQNQIMVVQPERANEYLTRGWRYRKPDEDTFAGIRKEAQAADSPFKTAASAPGDAFIVPVEQKPRPLSEQVAGMTYEGNAPERGNWTFRGGYVETGKPGPREGYGTLSRSEQIQSWRKYREGRVAELQAEEAAAAKQRAGIAGTEQAVKAAELDPYEMARIRAQGQYGGEAIKVRADAAARQQALAQALAIYQQALQVSDPQQKRQLMEIAASLANIMLGQRVTQSPQDWMSMLVGQGILGGAGLGGAVAAGAPPPKT